MNNLVLRIELPAYSHSFEVHVPAASTVHEVKQEIARICPGQPRSEGQRLIWRGRNLANEEKVDELWKSSTDSCILHLAVHPSAWVGKPPDILGQREPLDKVPSPLPMTPIPVPYPTHPLQMVFPLERPSIPSPAPYRPIPYIALKHQNAINALMTGTSPDSEDVTDLRLSAKVAIERVGWSWPAVLDERYPASEPGGLGYQLTAISGQQYLSLVNESAPPTPVQKHALSILSYTFSLLNLSVASSAIAPTRTTYSTTSPQVNQVLQQLGLPQIRVVPPPANQDQNALLPQLRELPLRPLLMPLGLLLFRTVLLLYFVAPARKPIFGVLILAWMLYEIWQPIRNGLLRIRVQRINRPNNNNNNPANAQAVNNNAPGAPPGNAQGPIGGLDAQAGVIFDTLANINLQAEEAIVNQSHLIPVVEPSLGHKLVSFFGLLLSTLHPAIWNRRRAALRRREGAIRTEASMRREPPPRSPDEEETENERRASQTRRELREQHARRPQWVQQYMERVLAEEWVDDLD